MERDWKFEFLLLIAIGTLSFLMDLQNEKCYLKKRSKTLLGYLYIHHLFVAFANFAWLSDNIYVLYFYLILPFALIVHWKLNHNECVITQQTSRYCGERDEFRGIFGFQAPWWNKWGHKTFLFIGYSIAIYKVCTMRKN